MRARQLRSTPSLKLPIPVDLLALQRDHAGLAGREWIPHFNRRDHDGGWNGLNLRSPDGNTEHLLPFRPGAPRAPVPSRDTTLLAECQGFQELLRRFECETASVRLLLLEPGALIKEHADGDVGVEEGLVRIHVPIHTNPRVTFTLGGEVVPMMEGECWYLDVSLPHRVSNEGSAPRVHLVIDAVVNEWLRGLLDAAGYEQQLVAAKYGSLDIDDENVDDVIRSLEGLGSETSLEIAGRLKAIRAGSGE